MAFQFNQHRNLSGQHAFLGASTYHWINDSDEKLLERYSNYTAAQYGTTLHAYAADSIKLGMKLAGESTLAMYVNDAIGFRMTPEQTLYYSENCFGTADSILFKGKTLRIHDLKTGVSKASMNQLRIYAAMFCLEYHKRPEQLDIQLRIYQNGEIIEEKADGEIIRGLMDKIVHFDKIIMDKRREEL